MSLVLLENDHDDDHDHDHVALRHVGRSMYRAVHYLQCTTKLRLNAS